MLALTKSGGDRLIVHWKAGTGGTTNHLCLTVRFGLEQGLPRRYLNRYTHLAVVHEQILYELARPLKLLECIIARVDGLGKVRLRCLYSAMQLGVLGLELTNLKRSRQVLSFKL